MHESRDLNNPKRIFEEKGDIELPKKVRPTGIGGITSIRRSEIISIAPDENDLSKVYLGIRPDHMEENPDGNPRK